MNFIDVVVILILLGLVGMALFFIIKRKGKGCCGNCSMNCKECGKENCQNKDKNKN